MRVSPVIIAVVLAAIVVSGARTSPGPARKCHASAYTSAQALPPIAVVSVKAMSCRDGVRVMRRVAPGLSANYYDRLGSTRNRLISGYRCSAYLIGDAAWRITCRRGHRVVNGLTAE
jgi:hypothetical protein